MSDQRCVSIVAGLNPIPPELGRCIRTGGGGGGEGEGGGGRGGVTNKGSCKETVHSLRSGRRDALAACGETACQGIGFWVGVLSRCLNMG